MWQIAIGYRGLAKQAARREEGGVLLARGSFAQSLVDAYIVGRHASSGEALFKSPSHAGPVEGEYLRERADSRIDALDNQTRNAIINDLACRSFIKGKNRR